MPDSHSTLRVYIVEDSAIFRKLLVTAVEAAGGDLIGTSENAQQAILELQNLHPDLVLLDIALSAGSGFDVLRAIQARGFAQAATKVVLTNYVTAENRELSFLLGASHFFDKSTEGWQALELINRMAAERRNRGRG